ncbi:MAG: site-specific DNA-methyltransferase [Ignavibacteriales bacterium]|nr:site-specific DNA-methyltransferase [Ignavibacteriales bacterium]
MTSVPFNCTSKLNKPKSTRNKTLQLSKKEIDEYSKRIVKLNEKISVKEIINKTINQDLFSALEFLPDKFVDLLIVDPPYNLSKKFNTTSFKEKSIHDYAEWIESFIIKLKRTLKPDASIYFCGDWHTSISIPLVLEKHFIIRNRITWEREKGRGAKQNWKNSSEDIWFCTVSNKFTFNTDTVKLKRKVLAPYRDSDGKPKDWNSNLDGDYRLTHPSNIWNDISVPFWSMAENTDHPTQKPEKLIAKLILASTKKGKIVLDPFLGSGTSSVVAKKLERKYVGIEIDKYYACLAEKRLEASEKINAIQGYKYGVFWERNTVPVSIKPEKRSGNECY